MTDRWPASMRLATAAAYLDVSVTQFNRLGIPAMQLTERGDRYWAREDLDAFIEERRKARVRISA
jgi:hypothetical protein